jgi:molybdate transport system ATP-binding protein
MSIMLRVENLSIRLGEFDLRDISFEVREGEYFVLLGPTGDRQDRFD